MKTTPVRRITPWQHLSEFALCVVFVGLGLGAPGIAAAITVEERLQQLEAAVEELQRQNAELRLQLGNSATTATVAEPTPVAAAATAAAPRLNSVVPAAAGIASRLNVAGFIQGQAEFGDSGDQRFAGINDRIYIRRARVYLTGSFAENFDFRIDGEFGAGSLSANTDLRVRANEIFVNWNRYRAANLRIGQIKPAFGFEQLANDASAYTIERSLGSDRLADGRQPSLGVFGTFPNLQLGYAVTISNGTGINSSANDNNKFLVAARVFGTLIDSPTRGRLTAGINVVHSEDNGVSKPGFGFDSIPGGAIDNLLVGERRGWGIDGQWKLGRLELGGELLRSRYEPLVELPAPSFEAESWQLTAAWFVLPNQLQAMLRREIFDPNRDQGSDATRNWTAGLTYFIKGDRVRLILNYLFGDAPGLPDDSGRWLARIRIVY